MCVDCVMEAASVADRDGGTIDEHLNLVWSAKHSLRSIRANHHAAARYFELGMFADGVTTVAVAGERL